MMGKDRPSFQSPLNRQNNSLKLVSASKISHSKSMKRNSFHVPTLHALNIFNQAESRYIHSFCADGPPGQTSHRTVIKPTLCSSYSSKLVPYDREWSGRENLSWSRSGGR